MNQATDLRIPGPTPLPPAVKRAMQQDMIPHRGSAFRGMFSDLLRQIRLVHQTDGDVVVLPGSGSAGWEAAIVNTLSPGDTVVSIVTGDFGARFAKVAKALRLDVRVVDVEWGKAATPGVVRAALERHPDARAVLYTHNETSTGVTNPLAEIAPVVRDHGALLIVDGVSSVAGLPLEMDAWGVDLVLSGSQKAWMCPPGLVIVAIGPRVWEAYRRADYPRFFWDFAQFKKAADAGNTPTTGPLTMLFALKAACDMIEAEGLANLYARHHRLGALVREGLAGLDFRPFADPCYASDTVTAALPPAGVAIPDLIKSMRARFGIEVAGGQAHLANELLRIGHMGWVHEPELVRTLDGLAAVTAELR